MRSLLGLAALAALLAGGVPALALPLTAPASALVDDVGWVADYDQGLALAREQKKDLLVEFTGSDWCPPCKALYGAVFSKPEFAEAVSGDFVLVKLDFPRSEAVKAKVPNPTRNGELAGEFEVNSFPTVLLMTTDGMVYGRSMGYLGQDLDEYIAFVREQRAAGQAAIDLLARYDAAEGDARVPLIDEAHALVVKLGESPLASRLTPIVRLGIELDAKDERGHKSGGLRVLLESGQATEEEVATAAAFDPENARGLLELVVLNEMKSVDRFEAVEPALDSLDRLLPHGIKDDENAKGMLVTATKWAVEHLEDFERAQRYAAVLRERFPDDADLAEYLDDLLGDEG